MIYYYHICKRKLWYFANSIAMEQNSENVQIGKILDESSYNRDEKHINIDDTINIDFIRQRRVIHEVKKSRSIEDASIWQVKYYLYYLEQRGIEGISGKIDYPLIKQSIMICLTEEDIITLDYKIQDIKNIIKQQYPPYIEKQKICKNCAFYDLCYI